MNGFDITHFPVTLGLLFANLVLSGFALSTPGQFDRLAFNIERVRYHKEYYRLLTSGFLHVDIFHFLFNMITLYFFGPRLELMLGSVGFAILYFGALLGGAFLSLYLKWQQPDYSAVGASGAVSGVVLAFCLFWPLAKIYIFFIPIGIPAFVFAGLFIIISLYFMDRPGAQQQSLIAHEAHLGGAITGLLIALLLEPRALELFLRNFG